MKKQRNPFFIVEGQVRGWCGHRHRTRAAADRCLARDVAGCRAQGGYSDRVVMLVPGLCPKCKGTKWRPAQDCSRCVDVDAILAQATGGA